MTYFNVFYVWENTHILRYFITGMNVRYNYGVSVIVLRGVWAGCSPFLWSLRSQVDIPQRM